MRTSDQTRPETLLAAVNTFFADMVILPSAVLAQEERPFQPPFLASAHRQSCSGTSRPGFLPSWGLCSAHSRLASSNRSRIEGFSGVVRSAYGIQPSSHLLPLKMKSVDFGRFVCLHASAVSRMGKHPHPVQSASHGERKHRFSTLITTLEFGYKKKAAV